MDYLPGDACANRPVLDRACSRLLALIHGVDQI